MAVAPGFGVDARFDGGRRRGEDDRGVFEARAHHRHVARMIGGAVVLLVGALMFFVDHDEAQIAERQKQRRARAGDDAQLAGRGRPPDARALLLANARVPFGRLFAEARGEAFEKLRGERDLRHHDQRLSAVLQRGGYGLEIDFGLAGAGDAFEQERLVAFGLHGLDQRLRRQALGGFERRRGEIGIERSRDRLGRRGDGFQRPFVDESVDDAGRAGGRLGERFPGKSHAALRRLENALAGGGEAFGAGAGHAVERARRIGRGVFRCAGGEAQSHAARGQRVAGKPIDEVAQLLRHWRAIEPRHDGLEIASRGGAILHRPDHAIGFPSP